MADISKAFPSLYLKAGDLNDKEVVVTMGLVKLEEVGSKRDRKPVLYFKGKEKGLVLNKTNALKITKIVGSPLTERWKGQQIKLYPTETEFAGETVECIRVKPVDGTGEKPAGKERKRAAKQEEPDTPLQVTDSGAVEPEVEQDFDPDDEDPIPF